MAEVRVKENESLDSALRRFKRQCARSGVIAEVKRESTTKNRALSVKRNLKQQESANLKANLQKTTYPTSTRFVGFLFRCRLTVKNREILSDIRKGIIYGKESLS